MPSSYTSPFQLEQQFTGENVNVWGEKLNTVIGYVADLLGGINTIALTGDYTLLTGNVTTNDTRAGLLKFTGTAGLVTLPAAEIAFVAWNACASAVTFTTGSGTTVVVDADSITPIFSDGTDVKTIGFDGQGLKDYIASAVGGGPGSVVPSVTGNAGKFLTNNGSATNWASPATTDLSDLTAYTAARTAQAIAFAIAL